VNLFFSKAFKNQAFKNEEKYASCSVADYIYPGEGGADDYAEKGDIRKA
jgi:hypothetical protein